MLVVISLGGNALLERGQPATQAVQRANVTRAAAAIAAVVHAGHRVVISHGNGPQIGLLALQAAEAGQALPLDVLGAETEGAIGYVIERELRNVLDTRQRIATLVTQALVDTGDPAFAQPEKPIGPVYDRAAAERLAATRGWTVKADGDKYRRVVASPKPRAILEMDVIRLLVAQDVIVVCGGGGGIPVARDADGGFRGIEAVVDKDWASALIAEQIGAEALLLLTDVDAVYADWGTAHARPIANAMSAALRAQRFAAGSMGPKVQAACAFVDATGAAACIGNLADALAILNGSAGTRITR